MRKVLINISFFGFLQVLIQALSISKSFFAAFILDPAQFGFISSILIPISFVETIIAFGFKESIINKTNDKRIDKDINTAFSVKLFIVGILSVVTWLVIFALNFEVNKALAIIPFIFLLRALENPYMVLFERKLKILKLPFIQSIGILTDVLFSLILLYLTKDPFYFILGILIGDIIKSTVSYFIIDFRPKFYFSKRALKKLFVFSKWIYVNRLFGYLSSQLDSIFILNLLSLENLGLYQISQRIGNVPMIFSSSYISQILFPFLSKFKFHYNVFKSKIIVILDILNNVFLLFFIITALYIPNFSVYLLGNKWKEIILIATVLMLTGFMRVFLSSLETIFISFSLPSKTFKSNIFRVIILLIFIYPFYYIFGFVGVSYSYFLSVFGTYIYLLIALNKLFELGYNSILPVLKTWILVSLIILIKFFLIQLNQVIPFLITVIIYLFIFFKIHLSKVKLILRQL